MREFTPLAIICIVFHCKFVPSSCIKKTYKKIPTTEVDVKAFVFPCSFNEENLLNSTFGKNHKRLSNCNRKLIIRMTVNSGGEYCSKSDGLIPIDHVVDGITGRKKRLLHPIMIRIKRERMYQLYDLQLVKSVNAEAREEVINYENTDNFTGCDTASSHPSCGYSFFKNKIIQFSEGFCCSCDQSKNDQRQPCDGRPGERKYPPDMKLAVRHHRSNRTSRGLEKFEGGNYLPDISSDMEQSEPIIDMKLTSLNSTQNKLYGSDEDLAQDNLFFNEKIKTSTDSNIDSSGCSNEQRKPTSDSSVYFRGMTIRSFQFEHSMATVNPNNSGPQRMSNIDILIENDKENGNYKNSVKNSNSISPDTLKLLMMNRIRISKRNETLPCNKSFSLFQDTKKKNCQVRSLFGNGNEINHSQKTLYDTDNNTFALKLLTGNSELEIRIASKSPVTSATTYKLPSIKKCKGSTNNISTKSTNTSFKALFNSFKPQTSNTIKTQNVHCKDANTKPFNCPTDDKTNNLTSIDKIVYQIVPVMNHVSSGLDSGKRNIEVVFKDRENTSRNLYIQISNTTKSNENMLPCQNNGETGSNNNDAVQYLSPMERLSVKLQAENELDGMRIHRMDLNEVNPLKGVKHIKKREACERQIRGGQSCSERGSAVPCYAEPETYFESAHCLRFSDLWYNVHRLVNPKMENSITVKIYSKHKTSHKKVCWENLTKRVPGRVGTVNEVLTDDKGNIVIAYSSDDKVAFSLDCSSDFLLVPQPISKHCKNTELKTLSYGGPKEYLVLKENEISFDGDECDRAGVTYAAFARQSHRCQREAGSCLKNQPLQFWREDKKAQSEGKQGQYFLRNYVTVTDQAILQNTTSNQVVLRAPYYEHHQSHIVVELNADHIDIIADRSEGQITEVYVDSTLEKTVVKAVVSNMGIAADLFSVDFVNCTHPLGPSDFDKPVKDEIPPQHRITYTATITTPLKYKETECHLAVYNIEQEVVASRRVLFVRGERCACVWQCQCVCHNYPRPGLPCIPLTLQDFHRAGFPGHMPGDASGTNCTMFFVVVQALLFFFLLLLLFGLIKAILGLCFPLIAVWRLWYLMPNEARDLRCYLESELACYPIARDCSGYPVNPITYRRTVHFLPCPAEFIMNVLFFILVARSCVCNAISRRASFVMYSQQPYQGRGACSPRYCALNTPCAPRSPCGSAYSNRRWHRLAAGAEAKDPQTSADERLANQFVQELSRSYHVYRNMTRPIGGVQSVPGTPYCIRGYFLESDNGFYEFQPPSPLMQIWRMDKTPLEPPAVLDPVPFRTLYHGASEVLAARELSRAPRGIVINAP